MRSPAAIYAQFSGIFTSSLPDIEKEVYESGRYKKRYLLPAKKDARPDPDRNLPDLSLPERLPAGAGLFPIFSA
jgi:hypothetical protein